MPISKNITEAPQWTFWKDEVVIKIAKVLALSCLGLVVLFSLVFLFSPRVDYSQPQRLQILGTTTFASETWKKSSREIRGKMVYAFVRSHLSNGLTKEEVISLLGIPDGKYLSPRNLAYRVGPKTIKGRFGSHFLFALIPNPESQRYDRFWIEPFPEDVFP